MAKTGIEPKDRTQAKGTMTTSTSRNGEKRSEARASRRRRQSYRALYEHTPVMMHSIDRDGRLTAVNNRWLEVLDYERSEVIGRRSTDFLTPSSRRYAFEVALPAFFEKGEAEGVFYQMVKKDGEVLDVSLSATAELDEAGEVVSSRCFIIDEAQHRRIQPSSSEQLVAGLDPRENPGLTQRQLEVLQSLALGKRYKEIAEELSVSLNTIKSHAENLYERLGAHNRTQAIRSARERGILNP